MNSKEMAEKLLETMRDLSNSNENKITLNGSAMKLIVDYVQDLWADYGTKSQVERDLLEKKVEELDQKVFDLTESIYLERTSLPPRLTENKGFMQLYDLPSYDDLAQKVEKYEALIQHLNEIAKEFMSNE